MGIRYLDEAPTQTTASTSTPRIRYLDENGLNELTRRSFLSSPAARFGAGVLGVGGGAYLGAQLGAAAGVPFPPAIPFTTAAGALIGAGGGMLATQQARRLGAAALEYDDPMARGEAVQRSLSYAPSDVAEGVLAEATGRMGGALLRKAGPTLRSGYLQTRELMTGVNPAPGIAVSERVLKRGAQIIKPEYREGVPRTISQKVQNGVNQFLERARNEYHNVTPQVKAALESKYLNVGGPTQRFRQALIESNIIDPSGRPLRGLLTREIGKESIKESSRLRAVLARLESLSRRTQRGRLGGVKGYVRADEIHRTIKQIDNAVKYSQRGVNPIGEQAEAMLKKLRHDLMEDLGKQVQALSARNSKYAAKIDLYEDVQKSVTNERVAGTIERLSRKGNEFPFPELREINKALPRGSRFLSTIEDYLAGKAFATAPGFGRMAMQLTWPGIGAGALGYSLGNVPGAAVGIGSALAAMSPRLYARELGLRRAISPYLNRVSPYLRSGVAPMIGGTEAALGEE